MALLHISLEDIAEPHIIRLIEAKVSESKDIEYKRESYGYADSDKAEWLKDVSSFANTTGGDILLGVDAKKGVPSTIKPLTGPADDEVLRLEALARTGIHPRISGLQFKPITVTGGQILLIRIPRSFNPPHRVVRQGPGESRFYARSSAGKYEPNVDELRNLFTLAPHLADRTRDFRLERVAKIAAGDAPVKLKSKAILTMHIVPLSAFDPASYLPPATVEKAYLSFPPLGRSSPTHCRVNFDGVLTLSNGDENALSHASYTQVYRNGIIETVASNITSEPSADGMPERLKSYRVESLIVPTLVRLLMGIHKLGVEPPFAVLASLIGVKGVIMNVGARQQWFEDDDFATLTRDQFHFSEVILESVPTNNQDCGILLRPVLEQLANLAGRGSSSSFGPNGEYVHMFG